MKTRKHILASKKEKRRSQNKKRKSCNISSLFTEIDNDEINSTSTLSERQYCGENSQEKILSSTEDVFKKEVLTRLKELLIRVNQIEVHLAQTVAHNKIEKRPHSEVISVPMLDDIQLPAETKETLDLIETKLADKDFQVQMVCLEFCMSFILTSHLQLLSIQKACSTQIS